MDWEQGILVQRALQGLQREWSSLGMMGTVSPWGWVLFLSPLLRPEPGPDLQPHPGSESSRL